MSWKTLALGAALAAALLFLTPGPSHAAPHAGHAGGFHGGSHAGVAHYGGYHYGGYGYGGFRPYSYNYGRSFGYYSPYAYRYRPYSLGYYPYGYGYSTYGYGYPYGYGYSSYAYGYPSAYSSYGSYPYSYNYYPSYSGSYPYLSSGLESGSAYSPGAAPPSDQPDVVPPDGTPSTGTPSRVLPSPSEVSPAPAETTAEVTVRVPAGAQLWFNGAATTATGPVRTFTSPPLTPGQHYTYEVRARWNEDGREVNQAQKVDVAAGAHVNVTFPVPPAPEDRPPE